MDLQTQRPTVRITAPEHFSDIAELINHSSLVRVRVFSKISLLVHQTQSVLASGEPVLKKYTYERCLHAKWRFQMEYGELYL